MITNLYIEMTQYLVVVCWLLVVGQGSGLTGTTISHEVTSALPLPSNNLTSSTKSSVQAYNVSQVIPTLSYETNATASVFRAEIIHPVHIETSSTTSRPTVQLTTTTAPPYNTAPTVGIPRSLKHEAPHVPRPWRRPSAENSDIHRNMTKTRHSLTKELPLEVPQGTPGDVFIRRKHKGPYHENDKRVIKPSQNSSVVSARVESSSNKQGNESILENGTPALNGQSRNNTKKRPFNNTRRPKNVESHSTKLKLVTTKKPKSSRKKPIPMGIPASSTVLLSRKTTSTQAPTPEAYNNPESDEYYASYDEYSGAAFNSSGAHETDLVPDPDLSGPVDEMAEAEVVLPDDSLADTDLHDHDLIDSVMYIYFGSPERDERGAGRQVLIVGAVIALVAQSLTLISVLRRLRTRPDESASLILLNAELALTVANLVFMFGVQATGSVRSCELVAVTLHYLHLVVCSWFLVNSLFAYLGLQHSEKRHRLRPWWLVSWCGPAFVVLLCVIFNRRGYETHNYCWMSVARGMLYSFMAPLAFLILLNTCLTVLGLRQLSVSPKAEDSARKSMKVSATLLPAFAVVWFLGVVALENSRSMVFPLLFIFSNGSLNWWVLACWLPADMSLWRDSEEDYDDDDYDIYEEVLKTQTDSQPLLDEPPMYVCGRRGDMCELQMDPICTISS